MHCAVSEPELELSSKPVKSQNWTLNHVLDLGQSQNRIWNRLPGLDRLRTGIGIVKTGTGIKILLHRVLATTELLAKTHLTHVSQDAGLVCRRQLSKYGALALQ